ncbi:uncharacterized protein CDV56_101780 [Aspergillus thermomutatus]|uniref:Phosphatidylglycerol/phosphatidylinositol transfer protein n=1 Tax=Aspergillus thermomutatus TaxID=41047 RepID=A0A397GH74_ASPTH|nr:uncharacterized protein CDV56_101780 [Aspergillus thermomutatus]RHZ49489.1 hypothetical protein CDV56_101780 [Aspergillus thermomutatus]
MKVPYFLTFFAATVSSQNVVLGLPAGQNLAPGSSTVVQIQKPMTLTGSQEVTVVIGLSSCVEYKCYPAADTMGTILYIGPYDPEQHEYSQPPYQNITVTIPQAIPKGNAQLNLAHFSLVATSAWPYLETLNQTVLIV